MELVALRVMSAVTEPEEPSYSCSVYSSWDAAAASWRDVRAADLELSLVTAGDCVLLVVIR